jgi:hypothetical protein
MSTRRSLLSLLASAVLLAPAVFPQSTIASALRYLGLGYLLIDLTLRAREGYLRRRPYWTRESWRGYFKLCLIPAGALVLLIGMMTALELRLPMVGAARSTARMLWAAGSAFFLIVFAVGLVGVIEKLRDGEPSRQFEWPRWLRRNRSRPEGGLR